MDTYEKQVERKIKLISKHQKELKDLLSKCPHPIVENKQSYYSGDYYNRAYTRYWTQCKICHAKSADTIENHNYYG